MPLACHGQGQGSDGRHCCWVNGAVCPFYLDQAGLIAWINATYTGQKRTLALTMAQGINHSCRVAVELIADNGNLINNRNNYNAAFAAHPGYAAQVRPAWAALEQQNGWAAGSYQCFTWGPHGGQCCFSETQAVNDTKMANLHVNAVTVRRAGGE